MVTKNSRTILITSAVIFGLLFHNNALGINLVIYELILLAWLFFTKQLAFKTPLERLIVVAQVFTLFTTVWHHSIWSYVIHFTISFFLVGIMISPTLRSLTNVLGMGISNAFMCFHEVFKQDETPPTKTTSRRTYRLKLLKYYVLPIGIILLFASLYGWANPEFGEYVDVVLDKIGDAFEVLFNSIDFWIIWTFLLGAVISIFVLRRGKNAKVQESDDAATDDKLRRKRIGHRFKNLGLKNETQVGIFLFGSLNVLLFAMNVMDFNHVWFNFKWEGQYLKQFVHYGTIVLIIAIVLSVVLVLVFFRGNLNFYKKNKTLKALCYAWLAQNGILALSAGIRNYYYIQYYSLAYKRIAIVFFLILALYGLYSVYIKVRNTRSTFYTIRKNAIAWLVVFTISTGFNWDKVIAEYNFSRGEGSFVHLNFLVHLSDSALPALDQPMAKLEKIDQYQEKSFFPNSSVSFRSGYRKLYLSPQDYRQLIVIRKQVFKKKWKRKNWLEWNYAEWSAYNALNEKG